MHNRYKGSILILAAVMLLASPACSNQEQNQSPTPTVKISTATATSAAATAKVTEKPVPTTAPTAQPQAEAYAGDILSQDPIQAPLYDTSGERKAYCGTGNSIGLQFYATVSFTGIGIETPTWTKKDSVYIDYSLYKWKGDYLETIASEPVAEGHLEDIVDNACTTLTFDAMPDGEYLLMAAYGSTKPLYDAGAWYTPVEFPGARAYLNDEVWYDVSLAGHIFYTKTPANTYGPLSDSGLEG